MVISVITINWLNPIWWQNTKLNSTQFWGLTTISNNPLLPGSDADLSSTDYKEKGVQPRIDLDKLFSGGPPKDGIPSIDNPQFEPISETAFAGNELIIGLEINGDARAYPYAILNWHELVNDTVGGEPVSVSYCPLCETNSVFKRTINGKVTEFGVSGKLYESCLVMYDRLTDTLYNQVQGVGIVGEKTNHVLERVPAIRTTVGAWRTKYPDAQILTVETGHNRDYTRYPYGSYYTDENIIFSVSRQELLQEHPKEILQVIFQHDEKTPTDRFSGATQHFTQERVQAAGTIEFEWSESTATATWDTQLETIIFTDSSGEVIPDMALFGFVHPAHFQ